MLIRILFFALFFWAAAAPAEAVIRYASHTGTGSSPCTNNSSAAAMCPVVTAINASSAGDEVRLLGSGNTAGPGGMNISPNVYQGANYMIDPSNNKSGSPGSPITVNCWTIGGVRDPGGCMIDSEFTSGRWPARFEGGSYPSAGNHYWVVEDVGVRHGYRGNVYVAPGSTNITVRRVVSLDTYFGWSGTSHFFCDDTENTLFEDVAAIGIGYSGFNHGQGKGSCTFRRAFARTEGSANSSNFTTPVFGMMYNSTQGTVESSILIYEPNIGSIVYSTPPGLPTGSTMCPTDPDNSALKRCSDGAPAWPGGSGPQFNRFDSTESTCCDHDAFFGGVLSLVPAGANLSRIHPSGGVLGPTQAQTESAFPDRGTRVGGDVHFENVLWWLAGHANQRALELGARGTPSAPSTLTNVSTVATLDDDIVEDAETTETGHWVVTNRVNATSLAGLDSASANPWTGSTGANLCYEYSNRVRQDGTGGTTAAPAWPWRMNDRILAASGLLGTYGSGYSKSDYGCLIGAPGGTTTDCTGSFPARGTIDVTAIVEGVLGTIPSACRWDGGAQEFESAVFAPTEIADFAGGDLAADWATITGAGFTESGGVASPTSGNTKARYDTAYGIDQAAKFTIGSAPTINIVGRFRWTGDSDNLKITATVVSGANNDTIKLESIVDGVFTTLVSPVNLGVDISAGDAFGADDTNLYFCDTVWGECRLIAPYTTSWEPDESYVVMQADSGSFTAVGIDGTLALPPDTEPPDPPASCSVVAQSQTVLTLGTAASTDNVAVVNYRYELGLQSDCSDCDEISATDALSISAIDLIADTTYYVRTRAWDGIQFSGYSPICSGATLPNPDTTPPSAPTLLSIRWASSTLIGLEWLPSTDEVGVEGYRVEAGMQSDCSDCVEIDSSVATLYDLFDPSGDDTLYFRVRAFDQANNLSAYSNIVSAIAVDRKILKGWR